ncbi:MAG: hypothetical protein ACI9XC_001676 [Gammaproteobacteria bacterium]|jgi:hypothetical protein
MMKNLSTLLLFFSIQLSAHESVKSNECPSPLNTGRYTSDLEQEIFQAELSIYESCMFEYIRKQQKLADVHEDAADSALNTWNDYLRLRMR